MMYSLSLSCGKGRPMNVVATSPEMAYRAMACWFNPETTVYVWDNFGNVFKYHRKLDKSGNLIEIVAEE